MLSDVTRLVASPKVSIDQVLPSNLPGYHSHPQGRSILNRFQLLFGSSYGHSWAPATLSCHAREEKVPTLAALRPLECDPEFAVLSRAARDTHR